MADKSFIEKQSDGEHARKVGVSYKIRKIGFPIAVVLCLLLLVVCIVLAIMYSKEVSKPRTVTPEAKKYEICDEERCFRLGMEMVKNMDKTIDPCEDFYTYACRGWQIRNPAKNGSRGAVSVTPMYGESGLLSLKKALETSKSNYSKNAAVLKTIRYYKSCLNTTAANALGLQSLKDLVQEYGGWSVSSNIDPSVPLTTRIGKVLRELGVETLLDISVTENPLNSAKRILRLKKPSTTMGMSFYTEKNSSSKEHQAYKRLLKTVGKIFTGSNSSDDKMVAIYDFEKSIAKIFKSRDDNATTSRRLLRTYVGKESIRRRRSNLKEEPQMSLLSFCKASGIPWPFLEKTLNTIFERKFSGNEEISLFYTTTKQFQKLYSLLQETNESVVVDYIMWLVMKKYAKALPALYKSAMSHIQKASSTSTPEEKPRWQECIKEMASTFDMTLNLLYFDLFLKDDPKKKIENLFEDVRSTFIEGLKRDTWMDFRTKENAKQKALAMKADIAYPSYVKNPSEIEKRYESLNITDSLLLNYKAISHFNKMENLNTYDSAPANKSEGWQHLIISTINAFYSPLQNRIIVPAGILQTPFYSSGFPMYLVYGGIGAVVGHEITHGFDGSGRKYDKNGKEKDWWSKTSSERFNQKAKCLEKQYDQYSFYGMNINGSTTLDENISDNGGIRLAYEAYQRWIKVNGVEGILPGLTSSPDQLFFIGYAQTWCSSFKEASAAYHLKKDELHTFPKYRVAGPLQNFDKFSEAFNCPANSPMNPSSKCVIW